MHINHFSLLTHTSIAEHGAGDGPHAHYICHSMHRRCLALPDRSGAAENGTGQTYFG